MDRKSAIESRMRALEAELAELEKFGVDDYVDGDVLIFTVNYGGADEYQFAALRVTGLWFLTGRRNESYMTWDELVRFWINHGLVSLRKVTRTKKIEV